MKIDVNNIPNTLDALIGSSGTIFYFALIAGLLSLLLMSIGNEVHKAQGKRVINVSGIYVVSFIGAYFIVPWLMLKF